MAKNAAIGGVTVDENESSGESSDLEMLQTQPCAKYTVIHSNMVCKATVNIKTVVSLKTIQLPKLQDET